MLRLDTPSAQPSLGSILKNRDDPDLVLGRGMDWLVGSERG